VWPGDRRWKTF